MKNYGLLQRRDGLTVRCVLVLADPAVRISADCWSVYCCVIDGSPIYFGKGRPWRWKCHYGTREGSPFHRRLRQAVMLEEAHHWEAIIYAPDQEEAAIDYEVDRQRYWGLLHKGGLLYNKQIGGGADAATGRKAGDVVLARWAAKRAAQRKTKLTRYLLPGFDD